MVPYHLLTSAAGFGEVPAASSAGDIVQVSQCASLDFHGNLYIQANKTITSFPKFWRKKNVLKVAKSCMGQQLCKVPSAPIADTLDALLMSAQALTPHSIYQVKSEINILSRTQFCAVNIFYTLFLVYIRNVFRLRMISLFSESSNWSSVDLLGTSLPQYSH